ncbi:hypothetical protein H0H81_000380 [Sphagnurus paluster]|uniref:DUF4211 domain-containing protein n=1 Tax=Sphagnurus paluster TaxID=117069 RepID=A0A9P7K6Q6_9AGAR|nr:hypothetical protein H0H81_000380 [Sphagnurus paluster]
MPPKQKKGSKSLKQTTLFEPGRQSTRASSSQQNQRTKCKRNAIIPRISDDDDNIGLGSIKFETKKTIASSDHPSSDLAPKKRKSSRIIASDDSDAHNRMPTKTRLIKRPRTRNSDDEDDRNQQPRRKKLFKKRDIALNSSSDEEDIADEVEKEHILKNRFRNRHKKTVFQKNLERLKSMPYFIYVIEKVTVTRLDLPGRKQGKPSESSSSRDEDEDDESDEKDVPFTGARPSSDFDSLFDEDSDANNSSDFIVEDGVNTVAELPMQFSMESHQDLDHQFKKIFQFFVHIAVRPAKERHYFMKDQFQNEEYFSVPLRMMRRKLSSLRDSLVASSVWRPDFKKPLEAYPEFDLIPLDFAVPSCDACHIGGRSSTLTGRLSGQPYDRWGFESKHVKHSSDSDNSDSDSSDEDAPVVEFHLGRFCARRTRVYHEFTHWEYALFKCIREEVDELHESHQSHGFFRIAYAGGMKPPKDLDDADGICDWLDQRKVIDMEWKKLKDMMESARHLELDKKKDEDD